MLVTDGNQRSPLAVTKLPCAKGIDIVIGEVAFFLFDRGEPKACFFHRRIREKPPSGGVSVLRKSIPVDLKIKEYGIQLLKLLNWHGVAMVEFELDERDNTPRLSDIY
jgi:predicted ATP-grasp superfamily ATP-dependent carboligase